MIKNERQYRITKSQAAHFANALKSLPLELPEGMHPALRRAQIDAVRSQLEDLEAELREYEELQQRKHAVIEASSLDELPKALIQARIAVGMSHKELAEKMGLKEQQIQRYEATDYATASFGRIREVVHALGIKLREDVFLPQFTRTPEALFQRLESAGLDRDFVLDRLLPTQLATQLEDAKPQKEAPVALRAAKAIGRIFDWTPEVLFGDTQLQMPAEATGMGRFKIPGGPHGRRFSAYVVYAHYLALVVANACRRRPEREIPKDFNVVRKVILDTYGSLSLKCVLNYVWDLGIPVLALNDPGAFHGACWRVEGRNVIVLKQRSPYLARWVHDLIHELRHASEEPDAPTHGWIEESEIASTRRTSLEEQAANRFAAEVLLDGRAEVLVQCCVDLARGAVNRLKEAAVQVAAEEKVDIDHLANYLAYRLSLQGINWWGAANNLQQQRGEPWAVARDVFMERFDFSQLNRIDANILERAFLD